MSNPLLDATVKETGKKIQVYRLKKGGFCQFPGCANEFEKEELDIKGESKVQPS